MASSARAQAALPPRGNFVIRNAYVEDTWGATVGDLKDADVHSEQRRDCRGRTERVNAPGATPIDGRGTIVLPGLVETHWHMWNTLLRGMSGEKPEYGYFRTTAIARPRVQSRTTCTQGTRLAAAEAINSGITFVQSWCHNIRSPDIPRRPA